MRHLARWVGFMFTIISPLAARAADNVDFRNKCDALSLQRGDDARRLHELFKLQWVHEMHLYPETATEIGFAGENGRWSDYSPEGIAERKGAWRPASKVLGTIDRAGLSAGDQMNFDLFRRNLKEEEDGERFPSEFMAITPLGGVQQFPAETLDLAPRSTRADYEDQLTRLKALARCVDQTIGLLQRGIDAGITVPRITLREVGHQIEHQMESNPSRSPLLRAFQQMPSSLSANDQRRLQGAAAEVLKDEIIPAYGRLREFMARVYLPKARESTALGDLPGGREWYAHNVRLMTTTRMSPEQIHELGLAEVKRIRAEMEEVIRSTGFKGDFAKFCRFLRTDSRFFYRDPETLLTAYRDICKRVDPELANLFGKLPRLPYGVQQVPSYAEASQTTAYYQPGSVAAGRAGVYFANTYALNTRPKWEMEALTLHEAVPGHHLQISLAQEMEDVPEFRKLRDYTVYVEGWALYAESLGTEMGFYRDPYSKFGQLTYEMWRAVRLVVDTGMHSMGWSRQRAIDYFLANTSKTEHDVTVEIDRYIVWPGQALAYKIGELKIKELRQRATRELGDRFDVRHFHDQILQNGALPLDVLEASVSQWIKGQKRVGGGG
jgi:uncharacterized protein (DUF885 family)